MSMNDPIADMLTRIRNANQAGHDTVLIPASKMKLGITEILKANGFINSFSIVKENGHDTLEVSMKYGPNNEKVILGLTRESKCGCRVYVDKDNVPKVQNGLGIAVLTTSRGIMTDSEARKQEIGGELICKVW